MLSGRKIVITGVTGKAVLPIAKALARDNEVFGVARFATVESRREIEAMGIRACPADLGSGDLSNIPEVVDYLLHFAWMRADIAELETAIRVNVEGAGLLLQHCRRAKAALVVSSMGVYSAHDDPMHLYRETDAIGRGATAYAQTSPATKLGLEAVARFCGRAFDLPITIARLNTVLGPHAAYHGLHVRAIEAGREIVVPGDPNAHSPVHTDDMIAMIAPLLDAAATNALIVNWCGDDVVTTQQSAALAAARLGKPALLRVDQHQGVPMGNAADTTRRMSLTGPCKVRFGEGLNRLIDEMTGKKAL